MERKGFSGYIAVIPAWALSLFAAILSAFILGFLVRNNYIEEPFSYIFWGLLLVLASFLICIIHPENVWTVPFLCNILAILPAACDSSFWNTSFGLIIGTGVVLSFISAQLGALTGKYLEHQAKK